MSSSGPRFRADRIVSLYVSRPWNLLFGLAANIRRIPILMYHSISKPGNASRHPYFDTETSPEAFEAQIRFLSERGYSSVSPEEVLWYSDPKESANKKFVSITFDDGFRDFYTTAFPILKKYAMSATMYLPTSYIQPEALSFKSKPCLTWSEVRELR